MQVTCLQKIMFTYNSEAVTAVRSSINELLPLGYTDTELSKQFQDLKTKLIYAVYKTAPGPKLK